MKGHSVGSIGDVEPRELTRRITFDVFVDSTAPHEAGPMTVTIDPRGLSCHWTGAGRERWEFDWADLRHFCEVIRRQDYEQEYGEGILSALEKAGDALRSIANSPFVLNRAPAIARQANEAIAASDAALHRPQSKGRL